MTVLRLKSNDTFYFIPLNAIRSIVYNSNEKRIRINWLNGGGKYLYFSTKELALETYMKLVSTPNGEGEE